MEDADDRSDGNGASRRGESAGMGACSVIRRRSSWEGSVGAPPASMEDADDRSYSLAASRHGEGAGMGARSVIKRRSSL